ncbi:Virion structural protein [Niallia circulans]|uniref:RCC1 domain-containing protein n=1 Tax=Niallia circulans TaxID=1397 RepID=UPI00077C9EEF|nr:RCC1 domain-containing protein [Niallia circulans]MDR4318403.1 hypothetical protein [Niallia circulans]MED3839275.1 RCC1 domain-containing protein [Niallia circulans]MED4242380.1 RCC1 domain-containing protein [Niallia circulans]MED4250482.1 RCC1 domain-containing protein [Niallia circulans]QKH59827.1 hypothetical protein FOC77_03710 [Niallia circulans]
MKKILMIISAVTIVIFSVSIYAFNGSKVEAATVGQKLTAPEEGWQRYDDTNSLISYSDKDNSWKPYIDPGQYKNNSAMGAIKGKKAKMSFAFYGTKFSLILTTTSSYSRNIKVTIDGVDAGVMDGQAGITKDPELATQIVGYTKTGLSKKNHLVEVIVIEDGTGNQFDYRLDAIDIDSDGKLIPISEYQPAQSNIYIGNDAMYQLDKNGDLYTWGSNNYGQLGLGDTSSRSISKSEKVSISEKVTDIVIGDRFVIALGESGKVYGWGDNTGKLLSDDGGIITTPVVIKEGIGAIFKAE